MYRIILACAMIIGAAACVTAPQAFAGRADVRGWEQLQWGDDIARIRSLYSQRIETPGFNEKKRLPPYAESSVACVLRRYRLAGVTFNVYFLQDRQGALNGILFATDPDSYIFKDDFDAVERALQSTYGAPSRSGDHAFTNYDYYRRLWHFPSTDIELIFHFDREAAAIAMQQRRELSTSAIYPTNISIAYFHKTPSQKAQPQAKPSGDRVAYEMTLSGDAVYFAFDRYNLTDRAMAMLDELALRIQQTGPYSHLDIHGHTDSLGSQEYNLNLGRERADAVKQYLHERHAIAPAMMRTVSFGKSRPVADNTTDAGRAKNRRVTIELMRDEAPAPAQP